MSPTQTVLQYYSDGTSAFGLFNCYDFSRRVYNKKKGVHERANSISNKQVLESHWFILRCARFITSLLHTMDSYEELRGISFGEAPRVWPRFSPKPLRTSPMSHSRICWRPFSGLTKPDSWQKKSMIARISNSLSAQEILHSCTKYIRTSTNE